MTSLGYNLAQVCLDTLTPRLKISETKKLLNCTVIVIKYNIQKLHKAYLNYKPSLFIFLMLKINDLWARNSLYFVIIFIL